MAVEWLCGKRAGTVPGATITFRSRALRFTRGAVDLIGSNVPKYCVLGYDHTGRTVVVNLTYDGTVRGARRFSLHRGCASIACEDLLAILRGVLGDDAVLVRCVVGYDAGEMVFTVKLPDARVAGGEDQSVAVALGAIVN